MDKEYQFQSSSSKRNGSQFSPPPNVSTGKEDATEEQPLDLGWVFAVFKRRIWIMATVAIGLGVLSGSIVVLNAKKITKMYQGDFRLLVEPITAEGRLAQLLIQSQSSQFSADEVNKVGSSIEGGSLVDYQTLIRFLKSPKMLAPLEAKIKEKYPENSQNIKDNKDKLDLKLQLEISRIVFARDGKEVGTKLMEFTYQDRDPQKIMYVLNLAKDYYLDYSRQDRLKSTKQGMSYIESQLPSIRKRVDYLQEQMRYLRSSYQLNDPAITLKVITEQSSYIDSQLLNIQAQLAEIRQNYQTLKSSLDKGDFVAVVMGVNPALYSALGGQLDNIDSQLAVSESQFRNNSLPIKLLKDKQTNINDLLRRRSQSFVDNLANQAKQLEAREKILLDNQAMLKKRIQDLPTALKKYGDLERELQVATDSLKSFLTKRETLKLGEGQQDVPWSVVSEPDLLKDNNSGKPLSVTNTQLGKNLAIAIILSFLFGIAVGFMVEILNTVFHTPDEIRWGTKLPVLGIVPFTKKLKKITKKSKPKSKRKELPDASAEKAMLSSAKIQGETDYFFLEAFRSLYTNLNLLNSGRSLHSVLIGSPLGGDGKSTVALHLAQTAAAVGQRVLLVDADLRMPQLHTRLGIPNVRGLSDTITKDLSLNDAIQRSPIEENLFVLTAGQPVPDPIKLLSSKKMQYLMEQFQAFFDLVIYDSPPLVGLADGHILGAKTDGTILVIAIDRTDKGLVTKALDGLKISGATVLGTVANGVKETSHLSNQRSLSMANMYNPKLEVLGNPNP
ncbi:MAG: GumC family protein [Microcoleaceae cyanobacterium]